VREHDETAIPWTYAEEKIQKNADGWSKAREKAKDTIARLQRDYRKRKQEDHQRTQTGREEGESWTGRRKKKQDVKMPNHQR